MKGLDSKEFPPTNKSFEVEFYAIAHYKDGEIVLARVLIYSTSRKSLIYGSSNLNSSSSVPWKIIRPSRSIRIFVLIKHN